MKRQLIKAATCALLVMACMVSAVKSGNIGNLKGLAIELGDSGSTSSTSFESSEKYSFKKIKNTIAKGKETNKDVIGWLAVPGTNIQELVTFSDKDNNYYVARDWTGKKYDVAYSNWNKVPATATYLDYRAKIGETWRKGTSRNLVLYGHNWNNLRESNVVIGNKEGYTMFAQLPSYTNKEFATENPYIYFSTGENEGIWKVFSVAYCEISRKYNYNAPNPSDEEFKTLISEWKQRSKFNFSTDVNEKDRLLTLSTCTRQYSAGDYQRFVVVARLLREGESENDKVTVEVNPNMKHPVFS